MLNTEVNRSPLTRRARAATVAALFAVAAAVASAQGALGTFSGSVLDPMNRTLVDARLILTNLQTQAKHEMRSDDTGRFEFTGLPRGDYALEVQFPGFSLLRGQITMGGQNVQQTLNLTVGTLQETITVVAGPSATPTPERKSASVARAQAPKLSDCTPTAHGGSLKPPRKLLDVRPEYPVHLANAGTMGTVLMEAVIGKDGSVTNVRVVGPAHPDFDAAAVAAVRQWEFSTTLLNCMPIDVVMKVTVNFRTA